MNGLHAKIASQCDPLRVNNDPSNDICIPAGDRDLIDAMKATLSPTLVHAKIENYGTSELLARSSSDVEALQVH